MNATHFYLETCRYVVEADLEDPSSWIEIQKHLSSIRLTLTCCVCGRLLKQPMGPARSVCHHYVCKDCIGGKMRFIKRGCGWCKSFEEFVENRQLECVVRCFRQLCVYLRGKGARILSTLTVDATVSSVLSIIQEATTDGTSENSAVLLTVGDPNVAAQKESITHRKSATRRRVKSSNAPEDQDSDKEICFKYKQSESFDAVNRNVDSLSNGDPFCSSSVTGQKFTVNFGTGETSHHVDRQFSGNGHESATTNDTYHDSQSEMNAVDSGCDSEKKLENFVLAEHDYNKCTADEMDTSAGHSNWTSEEEQQSPKRTARIREPVDVGVPLSRRSKLASAREHAMEQTLSTSAGASAAAVGNSTSSSSSSSNRNDTSDSSGRRCKTKGKTGCRCALATPNPGKLTCCGQRCPCYAAFKGCDNCKCRGCRNPRGDPRNIPASLIRPVPPSQMLASTPHSSLNKLSATVT